MHLGAMAHKTIAHTLMAPRHTESFLHHFEEPRQLSIREIRPKSQRSHGSHPPRSTSTGYLGITGTKKRGAPSRLFRGLSLRMVNATRHRRHDKIEKLPHHLLHAEPRLPMSLKPLSGPPKEPRLISRGASPPSPFFEEPKAPSHSDTRPISSAEPRLQTLATEFTTKVTEPRLYST